MPCQTTRLRKRYWNLLFVMTKTENTWCVSVINVLRFWIEAFLFELLQEFDDISFKQWQNTDSFLLMTHSAPIKEYIDMLVCAVEKLCSHWFLAKSQSYFLCRCKIEPRHGNAVILLEFAENFRFVVQDEVQGFHWTNLQCTLHLIGVCYKFNGETCHKSFCILWDDTLHMMSIWSMKFED